MISIQVILLSIIFCKSEIPYNLHITFKIFFLYFSVSGISPVYCCLLFFFYSSWFLLCLFDIKTKACLQLGNMFFNGFSFISSFFSFLLLLLLYLDHLSVSIFYLPYLFTHFSLFKFCYSFALYCKIFLPVDPVDLLMQFSHPASN